MVNESDSANGKPRLTFVLVHGTFGRGGVWVESEAPDSFRGQLRKAFECEFEVCFEVVHWGLTGPKKWFADNTLARRLHGRCILAEHLAQSDDVSESSLRYIVAHSHGGNVSMYALRNPDVFGKVTGVITLSTPFLMYRPQSFVTELLSFSAAALFIRAFDNQSLLLWVYTSIFLLIGGTLLAWSKLRDKQKHLIASAEQLERLRIPKREALRTDSGMLPFLAIRLHRDEVTLLFWFTKNAGAILRWLWSLACSIIGIGFVFFVVVRGGAALIGRIFPRIDISRIDTVMTFIDSTIMMPVMLASSAILLGIVIMRVRPTKIDHQAVAQILRDMTVVTFDHRATGFLKILQKYAQIFRIHAF